MQRPSVSARTLFAAVILVLAGLNAAPGAAAAPESARVRLVDVSADPTAGEARTRTYSRAELRSFVIAGVQIDRLVRGGRQARTATGQSADPRAVRARIYRIIDATPRIDRARYRAIAEAVRTNEVLRARVRRVIQALRQEKHEVLRPLTAETF